MDEMEEVIFNGFCKAQNEGRSVFCEFENQDGKRVLAEADCAYGVCPHTETCLLMKQAKEYEEQS